MDTAWTVKQRVLQGKDSNRIAIKSENGIGAEKIWSLWYQNRTILYNAITYKEYYNGKFKNQGVWAQGL